jgi:hypothetical protein
VKDEPDKEASLVDKIGHLDNNVGNQVFEHRRVLYAPERPRKGSATSFSGAIFGELRLVSLVLTE